MKSLSYFNFTPMPEQWSKHSFVTLSNVCAKDEHHLSKLKISWRQILSIFDLWLLGQNQLFETFILIYTLMTIRNYD